MIESLDQLWQMVYPYLIDLGIVGGVGSIIGGIIYKVFKKSVERIKKNYDTEKISTKTADKVVENIKGVAFKQSIQPIAESGLDKVNEKSKEYIDARIDIMENEYKRIIAILEKFYQYFDDSLVSNEKKEEMAKEIAKSQVVEKTIETKIEVVEEKPKETPKKAKKETKTQEDVLF